VDLQACEGSPCLSQAMPSIRIDPDAGQGSPTGAAGALRASLTGPGSVLGRTARETLKKALSVKTFV
jgi:hypothetical protein